MAGRAASGRVGQHDNRGNGRGRQGRRGGGPGRGRGRSNHYPHGMPQNNPAAPSSSFNGDGPRGRRGSAFHNSTSPSTREAEEASQRAPLSSDSDMLPLYSPSMGGEASRRTLLASGSDMLPLYSPSKGGEASQRTPLGLDSDMPPLYSPSMGGEASRRTPLASDSDMPPLYSPSIGGEASRRTPLGSDSDMPPLYSPSMGGEASRRTPLASDSNMSPLYSPSMGGEASRRTPLASDSKTPSLYSPSMGGEASRRTPLASDSNMLPLYLPSIGGEASRRTPLGSDSNMPPLYLPSMGGEASRRTPLASDFNIPPLYSPSMGGEASRRTSLGSDSNMPPLYSPSMGGEGFRRIPDGNYDKMPLQRHESHNMLPQCHRSHDKVPQRSHDNMSPLYHGSQEKMPTLNHGSCDSMSPVYQGSHDNMPPPLYPGSHDSILPLYRGSHENMSLLYPGSHDNMAPLYCGSHDNMPLQHHQSRENMLSPVQHQRSHEIMPPQDNTPLLDTPSKGGEASRRVIPNSSADKAKQPENEGDILQRNRGGARAMYCTGTVVTITKDRAFLRPINADHKNYIHHGQHMDPAAKSQRDVSFQLQGRGTFTGLMDPRPGDVFQYISNGFSERPRATFARLIVCTPRSFTELADYVQSLLTKCQEGQKGTLQSSSHPIIHQEEENRKEVSSEKLPSGIAAFFNSLSTRKPEGELPKAEGRMLPSTSLPGIHKQEENTVATAGGGGEIVLREINQCPAGFLLALQQPKPTQDIVASLLELSLTLSNYSTHLYMAQLRKFFQLFHGSQFLLSPNALQKYIAKQATEDSKDGHGQRNSYKTRPIFPLLLALAKSSPEILPSLLPLVQISTAQRTGEDFEFIFNLFKIFSYDKGAPSDLCWDKIPLVPLRGELDQNATIPGQHNQLVIISPVIKKGSYESSQSYFDTYFRLLREDCFGNLKKGIRDFQAGKLKKEDMKVWFKVYVMGVHFDRTTPGITIALRCDTSGSRQLPKQGSLLCVSCDGGKLKFPVWAVVGNSGLIKKNTAVFFVNVIDMKETEFEASSNSAFSMFFKLLTFSDGMIVLESPTYFQAYEPVLRSLQSINPEKLPFQEEIVHVKWPNIAPDYLMKSTSLDWKCVLKEAGTTIRAGVYEFDKLLRRGFQTMLNESQKEALQHVLKSRLAMIQGPPGTGKTFLVLKIIQLILSADAFPDGPILIVTYKNHALDQLLERCMQFFESPDCVVRVGGRSSSPILEAVNLKNLLSKSNDIFKSDRIQNFKRLEGIQSDMQEALQNVKACLSVKIYSSCSWLASAPEEFIYRLLSHRQKKDILLQQVPEGVSLSQVLYDSSLVSSDIYKQLEKVMVESLKQWLPPIGVFKQVHQSLLSLKGFVELSEVDVVANNCEGSSTPESGDSSDDDDDDEEEISEMLQQDKGNKNSTIKDWLASNFVDVTVKRNDMIFFGFSLEDLDSGLEQNLLFRIDPWNLSQEQRCIAVQMILKRNLENVSGKVNSLKKDYNEVCCLNDEINKRKKHEVLKNAKIIGMTTTGAAINQDILRALSPAVIIVEEAAEILEPQIITVLNKGLQHLILIGDHYQLRPSVECYELEKEYEFSVSMFERLAEHNKLPFRALNLQSRMRDEFLPLLKPIYPDLQSNLPCVSGIRNQAPTCMVNAMFFWTHLFEETKQRSVENGSEANMVIALTRWLVAEGNKAQNITVIASYNGQVSLIRRKMKNHPELEEVNVFTIDKFQGSENHIVIVSLVRSNDECKIGHLSARNRLCVAVSRAKGGLYICGNPKTLSRSTHWKQLIGHFHDRKCLADTILLQCPRHLSSLPFSLSSQDAHLFSPNLCQEPCHAQLDDCGHLCVGTCHDGKHLKCKEKVLYVFPDCGHSRIRQCAENPENLRCYLKISFQIKMCGHTKLCECWESKSSTAQQCDVPCTKTLFCGHPCSLSCSELCYSKPCKTCEEEERIKAKKERDLAMQKIKEKRREIDEKLKQLESEDSGPVVKKELGTQDSLWEYNMVKDRFEKYIHPDHQFYPIITKIEEIHNQNLRKKFLESQKDMIDPTKSAQLLFHGTSSEAIENIIKDGFRLPAKENNNMFGRGIYFATDSSKSAQELYTKGSNKLLLCDVLLGKVKNLDKPDKGLNLEKIRKICHDSVYSARDNKATGGTLFDEYVIYDCWQAYPKYIISYDRMDRHSTDLRLLNLRLDTVGIDFLRKSLKPSAYVSNNITDEFHFRTAESQFLRMQSPDGKLKVVEVEVIYNRKLEDLYERHKQTLRATTLGKDVNEKLVFHGTTKEAIEKIVKEGFKVGGEGDAIRVGALYGKGVYTATKPEISLHYAGDTGMMLLSKAVLAKEGVDYKGVGDDVFVIKNVHQLLPSYIVHYSN